MRVRLEREQGAWDCFCERPFAAASASPFIHVLDNITPLMVEYCACYQNTTGQLGPWSESDTAYVSPIQNAGFQSVAEDEAA
jgi:hypothetical protein